MSFGEESKPKAGAGVLLLRIVCGAILILAAFLLTIFSDLFAAKNIEISGAERFGKDKIYSYLEKCYGKNGFSLVLENNSFKTWDKTARLVLTDVEKEILREFSWIKDVSVKFKLPNSLVVSVNERNAVMFLEENGKFLCFDEEAFVVDVMSESEFDEFCGRDVLKGTVLVSGICKSDESELLKMAELCRAVGENPTLCGKIQSAKVTYEGEILLCAEPSLTVSFGGFDGMHEKVLKLAAMFESGYDGYSDGTIVFNLKGYDVFRPNYGREDEGLG